MDLYTRNVLVAIFAVLVMGTVVTGEVVTWANYDIDAAKDLIQKISLGVSTSGTLFLLFVYFKGARKQRRKVSKRPSFFSHQYHRPNLNVKR
jgi:hypothetical protein